MLGVAASGCDGTLGRRGPEADAGRSSVDALVPPGEDAGAPPDQGPPRGEDGGSPASDAGPLPMPSFGCDPLSPAAGAILDVTPADDLAQVVRDAPANTTIRLADGVYTSDRDGESNRRLVFRQPGVTLRSASGDAGAVIIDGEYRTREILYVVASDITIAELTVTRAVDHLAHVTDEGARVLRPRFYGVRFIDGGEQFLKVNASGGDGFVDEGVVECSTFHLTDEGRPNVERCCGGCYTGGIDAHAARDWVVRQSRFEGIYCAGEGLAEHAIHFWRSSRGTLVENNVILDCARGIGFGLDDTTVRRTYADDPYPGVGPLAHIDGVIRNNVVFAEIPFYDTGIEIQRARRVRVLHNTVVSTEAATGFFSSIDTRFDSSEAEVANNLCRRLSVRNGGTAIESANLQAVPLGTFVDVNARDFHLAPGATEAIDRGVVVDGAGLDLDGEARGTRPDIGADER